MSDDSLIMGGTQNMEEDVKTNPEVEEVETELESEKEEVWEPQASFDIKTGAKEIFSFLMEYSYTTPSGLVGLAISIGAGIWLITHIGSMGRNDLAFFLIIFSLYTVVNPVMLWFKAKKQAASSGYFSKPLHYELSEKGIMIRADKKQTRLKWPAVVKVKEYGNLIVVYMSKVNAFIWSKEQMGDSDEVKRIISSHVDGKRLKFKR
ncbi:MAG: YcxB family protein [Clostridia bacterium]|nr:YcxB family protein [Clostridia bacterium]